MTALFGNFVENLPQVSWRRVFEHTGHLRRFLIRISVAVTGHLTLEGAICSLVVARRVTALIRKSGLLFASLYLKQCAVHLQQYYADSEVIVGKSAVNVSLSRAGIPTIIPKHHRFIIMKRGDRGKNLVRLYLSWFSLCRIVPLAKRVSKATFESISEFPPSIAGVRELCGQMKDSFKTIQELYMPWISTIPMFKGISWKPTWKSVPNDDRQFWRKPKPVPNIFSSLKYETASFVYRTRIFIRLESLHPGMLWSHRVLYPLDYSYNRRVCWESLSFFLNWVEPFYRKDVRCLFSGFHMVALPVPFREPRRLFAIGNYVLQRLLYPVHNWAMQVLSRIPTDGTFNHERPIHRLRRYNPSLILSIDLKAATDRWPLEIISAVFTMIFGRSVALCVVDGCLRLNFFQVSRPLVKRSTLVAFTTGQPLGYYGSWALFSISHHYLVWFAALLVYPRSKVPFRKYALLGDDIVIAAILI